MWRLRLIWRYKTMITILFICHGTTLISWESPRDATTFWLGILWFTPFLHHLQILRPDLTVVHISRIQSPRRCFIPKYRRGFSIYPDCWRDQHFSLVFSTVHFYHAAYTVCHPIKTEKYIHRKESSLWRISMIIMNFLWKVVDKIWWGGVQL